MVRAPRWRVELARDDERRVLTFATGAIFVTQRLQDCSLSKHRQSQIVSTVVPCAVNLDDFNLSATARSAIRQRLDIVGRKVFCYAGGVSAWQCIDEMLDLVATLRKNDPEVFFLFLTNGNLAPYQARLHRIGEAGQDYITLAVQHNEVSNYLNAADFGLLLRAENAVNLVASPTKLGEYLASGLPVVTTRHAGNASSIVPQTSCGFVLKDPCITEEELHKLLAYISEIMESRTEVANRCHRAAIKHLSWDSAKRTISDFYTNLITKADL
jgi:glycosyltransferase involved in cell wall biosynthesis